MLHNAYEIFDTWWSYEVREAEDSWKWVTWERESVRAYDDKAFIYASWIFKVSCFFFAGNAWMLPNMYVHGTHIQSCLCDLLLLFHNWEDVRFQNIILNSDVMYIWNMGKVTEKEKIELKWTIDQLLSYYFM